MAAPDNWIAHLRLLVDKMIADGRKPREAYREVAETTGLGEEYVYQLHKDYKHSMSKDAAEKLARGYAQGRPLSWIDQPPDDANQAPARHVSDSDWAFLQDFKLIPEEEREARRREYRERAETVKKLGREWAQREGVTRVFSDERVAKTFPPSPRKKPPP